jgi:hypothetical protein
MEGVKCGINVLGIIYPKAEKPPYIEVKNRV